MPVVHAPETYKMRDYSHTIIPTIGKGDLSQGLVGAMIRRYRLKVDGTQIKIGRVILSEQIVIGRNGGQNQYHFLHLIMCDRPDSIPAALVTTCNMLGIVPGEKIGILLDKRRAGMPDVAVDIGRMERFESATVALM